MADKKPSNRERIKEIVTGIEANIQDLFQSDKFADYLRTMSRFHSYSYNNTILIHMQMPSATHVAGFNKWKNQFGRHVKKGEKGLTIIAPTPERRNWTMTEMLSWRNGKSRFPCSARSRCSM